MGIVSADIGTLVALHFHKAHPYIGLNVFHQVAYVN
jgi:hypothetical protein